jgi:hypothetical protein
MKSPLESFSKFFVCPSMSFFMLSQGKYMEYEPHTSGSLIFFPFLMISRVGSSKVKGKYLKMK